uniref:non-specific serine/threonine protein kinase n=1 Tax=Lotharella globosa TaxID=91324 RepID=A0A7S3Z998_9EUKA|mmetsp:Transcript_21100/g.42453  ORF Transcript_21100/g.42453 Transcript_21100/m.42453 type:complete len:1540 (-) Transcript_21100:402-5021(-)
MDRKYDVQKKLGEGGFGKVFLAREKTSGKSYVVKQIDCSALENKKDAMKEIDFLSKMSHPNIIGYREWFEEAKGRQKYIYIAMDYADGGDLEGKIKQQRGRHFKEKRIVDWTIQICLALKHVHDRKILHRDIKSQNIFLMRNGMVKLGDFGIAKTLKNTRAMARTQIGTPYYLSPEICRSRAYDAKSDMWAVGVVMYELTNLRHPFTASSMEGLVRRICNGQPGPIVRTYSANLRNLVMKLLNKKPKNRPTVNTVLRKKWFMSQIERFLSSGKIQEEFSHTVIHGKIPPPKPPESRHDAKFLAPPGKKASEAESKPAARAKPVKSVKKDRRRKEREEAKKVAGMDAYRQIHAAQRVHRQQVLDMEKQAKEAEMRRKAQEAKAQEMKRRRAAFAAKRKVEMQEAKRRGEIRRKEAERRRREERRRLLEIQQREKEERHRMYLDNRKAAQYNMKRAERIAPSPYYAKEAFAAPAAANSRPSSSKHISDHGEALRRARIEVYQDRMKLKEKMKALEHKNKEQRQVPSHSPFADKPPSAWQLPSARDRSPRGRGRQAEQGAREAELERARREAFEDRMRLKEKMRVLNQGEHASPPHTADCHGRPQSSPRVELHHPHRPARESEKERLEREKKEMLARARKEIYEDRMRLKAKMHGIYHRSPPLKDDSAARYDALIARGEEVDRQYLADQAKQQDKEAVDHERLLEKARIEAYQERMKLKEMMRRYDPRKPSPEQPLHEVTRSTSEPNRPCSPPREILPVRRRETAQERHEREHKEALARARKEAYQDRMRLKAKMKAQRQRSEPAHSTPAADVSPSYDRVAKKRESAQERHRREHEEALEKIRKQHFEERMRLKKKAEESAANKELLKVNDVGPLKAPQRLRRQESIEERHKREYEESERRLRHKELPSNIVEPEDKNEECPPKPTKPIQMVDEAALARARREAFEERKRLQAKAKAARQAEKSGEIEMNIVASKGNDARRMEFEKRMKERQERLKAAKASKNNGGAQCEKTLVKPSVKPSDVTVRVKPGACKKGSLATPISKPTLPSERTISSKRRERRKSRGRRKGSSGKRNLSPSREQAESSSDNLKDACEGGDQMQRMRQQCLKLHNVIAIEPVSRLLDFQELQMQLLTYEVTLGKLKTAAKLLQESRFALFKRLAVDSSEVLIANNEEQERGVELYSSCAVPAQRLYKIAKAAIDSEEDLLRVEKAVSAGYMCLSGINNLANASGKDRVELWLSLLGTKAKTGKDSKAPVSDVPEKNDDKEDSTRPKSPNSALPRSESRRPRTSEGSRDPTPRPEPTPRTAKLMDADALMQELEKDRESWPETPRKAAKSDNNQEEDTEEAEGAEESSMDLEGEGAQRQAVDFINMMNTLRKLVKDNGNEDKNGRDEEEEDGQRNETEEGTGATELGRNGGMDAENLSSPKLLVSPDSDSEEEETQSMKPENQDSAEPNRGMPSMRRQASVDINSLAIQVEVFRSHLEQLFGTDMLCSLYGALSADNEKSSTEGREALLKQLLPPSQHKHIGTFEKLFQLEDQLWIQ